MGVVVAGGGGRGGGSGGTGIEEKMRLVVAPGGQPSDPN